MPYSDFLPLRELNDVFRLLESEGFTLNEGEYRKEFQQPLCKHAIAIDIHTAEMKLETTVLHSNETYITATKVKPSRFHEAFGAYIIILQESLSMTRATDLDSYFKF